MDQQGQGVVRSILGLYTYHIYLFFLLICVSACLLFTYEKRTLYMGNKQENIINQGGYKDKMGKPGYVLVKVYSKDCD